MAATRTYASPDYTGPSADVQRGAIITRAAGYASDRERLLDLAVAATQSPDDINTTAIAALGETVELLDTLLVARDAELAADRRERRDLQRSIDAAVSIWGAAARELSAARDQLLVQAHQIEQLRISLAVAEDLRVTAQQDADAVDLRRKHAAISAENAVLRAADQLATAAVRLSAEDVDRLDYLVGWSNASICDMTVDRPRFEAAIETLYRLIAAYRSQP